MERDQDLIKIKELLRHTGEFIAYFELAETKMIEWRNDIEQQALAHQQRAQQQIQSLHNELDALQEVLTQAGLARFRMTAEKTLGQGEEHLALLQKTGQDFFAQLDSKQLALDALIEKNLLRLDQSTNKALEKINNQLSQYDAKHFRLIARESCEQVEKAATNAVNKSQGLLRSFQWRSIGLTLATTLITAFAIGLYINNELPWEIHQHALNERQAGKVLMKAWPALTEEEKQKILNKLDHEKG